jgi:signal transduction histidine kinase
MRMKRKERIAALFAGVMIVLALLTVFAIELSDNQIKSRQDIQNRVHERAVLAGALLDSLFETSAHSTLATDTRLYGTPSVTNSLLEKNRRTSAYLVLVDKAGNVLAHSAGFTPQARGDLRISETLRLLRRGEPWALGNVLPYGKTGVLNFGVAIPSASGTRYLLSGILPAALGPFLSGDLRRIPGVKGSYNSVVDGNGVFIASTNPARPAGYKLHTAVQRHALVTSTGVINGRYYDQEVLPHTSWRIFLSAPEGALFASVSGIRKWLPWFIFIAFGLVAIASLLLVRRAMSDAERVREANDQLTEANVELADAKVSLEEVNGELADSNRALGRSNQELERQARELVRSNAELDQFASIASHDLQEPLRKVRTFTERISETEADVLSERGLDYLQRANASAERMQTLIEDLLRYSRVSTQGRPFAPVDLRGVADDVIEDLSEQITSTGAVVRVGSLPTINADAPQMRQLLQNLISNAIKFRREGVTPEVDVDSKVESGWVTISVRDNGIGFDPQYSRRIFRVFERLHGRGTYPGTGIGLALCRKIAERHGGTIVARSIPDEGSTFTVTMQTQRTEAVSDAPQTDDEESAHATTEEPYVAA